MNAATGTTSFSTTHDGLRQLRRHWAAESPRAALLLVHGIGEHSGRYEHVGRAFATAGIDTLSFDARGFGQTEGRRGHVETFDHYIADVAALLAERRTLGVPTVLMGHSLGGLVVATYLVGDHPQPDLAVLSAPALQAKIPGWQRTLAPVLGRVAPTIHIKSDFDGTVLSRDVDVQEAYDNDPLRVGGSTARLGNEVIGTMKSTAQLLDRIELPLYVFHGSDDTLVPPSASEAIGELPNATRKMWAGLRHESLNEPEQDQVIADVVAWIDAQLSTID